MKKHKIITLIVTSMLLLSSCGKPDKPVEVNRDLSDMFKPPGTLDIEYVGDPEYTAWPKDFMPELPIIPGEIVTISSDGYLWKSISLENTTRQEVIQYIDEIKEVGFNQDIIDQIGATEIQYSAYTEDFSYIYIYWIENDITTVELSKSE